ncbi:MAG TPA: hypothetical protein VMW27_03035, partial [Thermoanaerobaculia bacterium]|nr:hypothetical protein [Thermoanaerobaculia bacterium]
ARLVDRPLSRRELEAALSDGRARERFDRWAELQGASPAWLQAPVFPLAPVERPLVARRSGKLARIENRQIGLLMVEAGGGRPHPGAEIDFGVSLRMDARLGQEVREGDELARLFLRRDDDRLVSLFESCFLIDEDAAAPELMVERVE